MTSRTPSRLRFAPSPTGDLHIGNARTAIINRLLADHFILRFDDTDAERSTVAFAEGIERDLRWLGIVPDEIVRQSERFALYDARADELRERGLLYACYETPDELDRKRKRLASRGRPPVYDRAALKLSDDERAALEAEERQPHWRFLLPNHDGDPFAPHRADVRFHDAILGEQTVDLASMSDPVLVRADGTYLYTLPSVADDIDLRVTDVVRGADHVANTGVQIALFEALGAKPPRFAHHNLLQDAAGEGLSKRSGSLSLAVLRDEGMEPEAVAAMAVLTGTSEPVHAAPLDRLRDTFRPEIVSHSPARFAPDELRAVNRAWIHELPWSAVADRFEGEAGADEALWNAVRANLERVADFRDWLRIRLGPVEPAADDAFLGKAADALPEEWNAGTWGAWTTALKERTDRRGKALFMPLRLALTGLDHGPELGDLLPLIERDEVLRRLQRAK